MKKHSRAIQKLFAFFLLCVWLQGGSSALGQRISLPYLVDSSLAYRNDTARLFAGWTRSGYPDADWIYGSSSQYLAMGDYDADGQTISRYVGLLARHGRDEWESRNRCVYYRTGDAGEYGSWPRELESMGFRFLYKTSEAAAEASVYGKGHLFVTLRRDQKGYCPWRRSDRKKIIERSPECDQSLQPAYVALAEAKPLVLASELLDLYLQRKDTSRLKKTLLSRGFDEAVRDNGRFNVLGTGDERNRIYSEVFTVGLLPSDPVLIYQTSYALVAEAWEPWLLANGFTEVAAGAKTYENERFFLKGELLAGIASYMKADIGKVYRIYLKKNGAPVRN